MDRSGTTARGWERVKECECGAFRGGKTSVGAARGRAEVGEGRGRGKGGGGASDESKSRAGSAGGARRVGHSLPGKAGRNGRGGGVGRVGAVRGERERRDWVQRGRSAKRECSFPF